MRLLLNFAVSSTNNDNTESSEDLMQVDEDKKLYLTLPDGTEIQKKVTKMPCDIAMYKTYVEKKLEPASSVTASLRLTENKCTFFLPFGVVLNRIKKEENEVESRHLEETLWEFSLLNNCSKEEMLTSFKERKTVLFSDDDSVVATRRVGLSRSLVVIEKIAIACGIVVNVKANLGLNENLIPDFVEGFKQLNFEVVKE